MSHDRKPGRVTVVQADGKSPQRRRGDRPTAANASATGRGRSLGRRGRAVLIALFLLASIGSAVAVELRLPS